MQQQEMGKELQASRQSATLAACISKQNPAAACLQRPHLHNTAPPMATPPRREHKVPLALASRTPTPEVAQAFLQKLDLAHYFSNIQLIPAADGWDQTTSQKGAWGSGNSGFCCAAGQASMGGLSGALPARVFHSAAVFSPVTGA